MIKHQGQILKEFSLRSTISRSAILDLFLHNRHALSYSDIEKEVATSFDRVTVYRTLKTFLDKGVVHKVLDDRGGMKYALCNDHCTTLGHHHDHVHFKCTKCGQTNCMDDVAVPGIKLPKGYQAEEFNLLIQGICNKCQ
jgi:Fur family ferric uptake transcriptional regulator